MIPDTLLTICVGLVCSLQESNLPFSEVYANSFVESLSTFTKAERTRLYSFKEWYRVKSEGTVTRLLSTITEEVNAGLLKIQAIRDNSTAPKEQIDRCYLDAFQDIKHTAEAKLSPLVACAANFVNATNTALMNMTAYVNTLLDIENQLLFILSDCKTSGEPGQAMMDKANKFVTAVNDAKSIRNTMIKKNSNEYYELLENAVLCQLPFLNELQSRVKNVSLYTTSCLQNDSMHNT